MYFVYILISKSYNRRYVGMTNNIKRRFKEHNSGRMKSTKAFTPWEIIYVEKFPIRIEARKREKYFKSAAGRRYLKSKFGSAGYLPN